MVAEKYKFIQILIYLRDKMKSEQDAKISVFILKPLLFYDIYEYYRNLDKILLQKKIIFISVIFV